jgi:CHAT domain-containing protein/tetratricopeptide (TPR) repeat protein
VRRYLPPIVLAAAIVVAAAAGQSGPPVTNDTEVSAVRALLAQTRYSDAESRARALLSARESRDPDSLDVARALDVLVQVLVESGKAANPDALSGARRAVRLKETRLATDDPEVAVSLSQLGLVLRRTGQLNEAGDAYARALRIQERAFGPDHPEVARTLAGQAALANSAGEFARARDLGERAMVIAEREDPQDAVLTAMAANNLAIALYELNDYRGAERRFQQALHSYEAAFGADHPEVAKTSTNLANVIGEAGDLAGARVLYERAIAIQERRQGRDHPDVALGLNNLADIYVRIGDYAQAQALFERALTILERAYGPEHTRVAMALGNLAEVRVRQRAYAAAQPLYERALRIRQASLGPDHPSLVYTLTGLGDLQKERGRLPEARALYERALTIAERGFGADHPMLALTLNGLGEILLAQGDIAAAEARVAAALEMRRRLLGNDHPLVAESRAVLALILARTGRHAAAVEAALEAERVAREHMQVTAQALSERHAMTYAERRVSGVAIALSLLESDPGVTGMASRAWDAVTRSRAAVLEEIASRQRLIAHAEDAESVRLARALVAARDRLAGLLTRGAADPASRSQVEAAARERDQAERALAEQSLRFRRAHAQARVGIAQAVAALPSRSALVGFVKFRRVAVSAGAAASATDGYFAFVARADGSPVAAIPLGDADRIDAAVGRWRVGIANEIEAGGPGARAERLHRRDGATLRTLVWDPLQSALGDSTDVFVVADGALHVVNLGALPRTSGGYLIEDTRLLHHLSAERDLIETDTPLGAGLLIVDNPDYDVGRTLPARRTSAVASRSNDSGRRAVGAITGAAPGCQDLQSLQFDSLPDTRREADAIGTLWTNATQPPSGSNGADRTVSRLSGALATESALKRATRGMRVVHLATHGFFLGAWCPESSSSAPLLLAGLALAGSNDRLHRTAGEDDGILMAEEIATLDMQGVEWAVLSACDTGVGLPRAGEGLFGLRRMFQIAGARTVIVSLWPVVDRTAREWMTAAYHDRFITGLPTAEAVRKATLQVIASRRARGETTHPAYWAAFIAIGR